MILDTSAISALFEGDHKLAEALEACQRPSLPVIAIGEYRYGLERSRHRRQLAPLLDTLIAESNVLVINEETTVAYTAVRNQLRDAGCPIPENDVWIAALTRQHQLPLLSLDRHFDEVPDLVRISW